MDPMFLIMRLLHVGLGVFWVGTLVFTTFFLLPAMREAGPDGAKVGEGLARRNFLTIMPIVALITLASGLWLYWKTSVGFTPEFMRSRIGMAYGIGAAAAILAFVLGITIVRPAMNKSIQLAQAGNHGEAQAFRARAGKAGLWVALLLIVTAITMAIARYL